MLKTQLKKIFKLSNNANLRYDCRNNSDNCGFIPIFDEMNEIIYLTKYYNYFDKVVSKFVSSNLLRPRLKKNITILL